MSAPLVQNAADSRQVRHAGRKEKDARQRALDNWKAVLGTREGREVVMGLLTASTVYPYQEPSHQRGDEQQRLIGMQRIGQLIFNTVTENFHDLWLQMLNEERARARSAAVEAEAVRTSSATQQT